MKATPVTFSGPQPIAVGRSVFGAPRGSQVAHAATRGLLYLLTPDGALHLLRSDGELPIPPRMFPMLRARYFSITGD